jgi:nicotinate phosphoribosyltransferase
MSQLAYEQEADAEVTFTFKNRGDQRLSDYVDPELLQQSFDALQARGFGEDELSYLSELRKSDASPVFSAGFLAYLREHDLPKVHVHFDEEKDDIAIESTGKWPLVTFWETVVMSTVNEHYFEGYLRANNIDPFKVYDEGDARLSDKIAVLNEHPDIHFSDFGTRRHFSIRWQKYVLDRLTAECPENFVGTSNVALSKSLGTKPVGTFAHEMPMVYAGLADSRNQDIELSHEIFLEDWYQKYGPDLSIALTDTFGSDFFFKSFTPNQARTWRGVRHDSGDPFIFGEKLLTLYQENDIDPQKKTVIFSDGLDIDTIVRLHERFNGRINVLFGWGTTLTNDLDIPALNIVMKATEVNNTPTVKLSDNIGKHTGPEAYVERYQHVFSRILATI